MDLARPAGYEPRGVFQPGQIDMTKAIETLTPEGSPPRIGPYNHIAKAGNFITIGGIGGVDPATGELAGDDVAPQTTQILRSFETLLRSVDSDLDHVLHIHVFLKDMDDFDRMNEAYVGVFRSHLPARTVIAAKALPRPGFRVLMNLTAVTRTP